MTIAPAWDAGVLRAHSAPHFMQGRTWAAVRARGPWTTEPVDLGTSQELPALAYERRVDGVGTLRHLPRVSGLTPDSVHGLTERVVADRGCAFATKLEIYQPRDATLDLSFAAAGWRPTRATQYRYAIVVDLRGGEEAILTRMKKRARAEIRIGERNGIVVERASPAVPTRTR